MSVNATERAALLDGAFFYEQMNSALDERTLEILDRRRKTAIVKRRGWLVRRALLSADVLGLALAFATAQMLFGGDPAAGRMTGRAELALFLATIPGWIVVAKLYGLYDSDEERTDHSTIDDLARVFHMVTVGAWVLFAGTWLTGLVDPDVKKTVAFWGLAITFVVLGRAIGRGASRRSITYLQNTIIVGAGDVGQLIARKLLQHPEYGINLVGFVDAEPRQRRDDLEHLTLLGTPERLPALVRLFDIERVVIAFSNDSHEVTLDLIRSLKDLDVQVDIVPRLFEVVGSRVDIHTVEGIPIVGLPPLKLARSSKLLKRATDVVLSAFLLFLLAPLFAAVAFLIRRDSAGPVFFRQVRMGENGKTFRIYKFRTMVVDAEQRKAGLAHLNRHNATDPRMFKIEADPRVTGVGRVLRRYSLDELPQLVNVLRGDMSLVGPRPLILDEDAHADGWARKRLDLKPGMTGLWQVLGRSQITFEEMVKLDYLYVTSWSLWNDFRLLARTVPLVVKGGGHAF